MPLDRLIPLAVFLVAGHSCTQLLWILAMQAYAQGHHDFRRVDHLAWYRDESTTFIKADAALLAETALAVAQIQFIMQIAAQQGQGDPLFSLFPAPAGIQDLDPLQELTQFFVMGPRVTDDGPPESPRNANAKG